MDHIYFQVIAGEQGRQDEYIVGVAIVGDNADGWLSISLKDGRNVAAQVSATIIGANKDAHIVCHGTLSDGKKADITLDVTGMPASGPAHGALVSLTVKDLTGVVLFSSQKGSISYGAIQETVGLPF